MQDTNTDERKFERIEEHAGRVVRSAIQRELECELRGLLMAARMHNFTMRIEHGKPVVEDLS